MLRIYPVVIILSAVILVSAQSHPKAPADQIGWIQSLIRAQRLDEALQTSRDALKRSPGDSRIYTLQGIIFSLQQRPADALTAFDHALRLAPDDPAALRGEAQLLYATHDKRAIPLLQRIVKADPGDQTAHEMLGVLDKDAGNCSGAIDEFKTSGAVIDRHPESLEAYAACLFDDSRFDEVIPVLQQLVSVVPNATYPKYDLAVVLVRAKQYQAAVDLLQPLLPDDPARASDPDLLSLASEAYERLGNTPKAVALLRQAIVLDPTNPAYFTAFADLCLTHDSFEIGIRMLNAGIARLPDEASLYLDRGLMYANLGDIQKAKEDFKHAEQLDSAQSLSAYATDLAELESNHPDVALNNIRAQLKVYPDSPLLQYIFAKLLDTTGGGADKAATTEALQAASKAVELKPDMADAHNLLGSIYTRTGKYDKAIEECRLALKYAPSDDGAMYHLLLALRHDKTRNHDEEIASLTARLAKTKMSEMKQETERKRFKLVAQQPSANAGADQK